MKIIIKEPLKTICSNENSMHRYFGWPSVARLQDGSLLAASSGFRLSHICPFGKVAAVRSYDEGKTWTAPEIVMDTLLDDRDAGICTFGENGVIVPRGDVQALTDAIIAVFKDINLRNRLSTNALAFSEQVLAMD